MREKSMIMIFYGRFLSMHLMMMMNFMVLVVGWLKSFRNIVFLHGAYFQILVLMKNMSAKLVITRKKTRWCIHILTSRWGQMNSQRNIIDNECCRKINVNQSSLWNWSTCMVGRGWFDRIRLKKVSSEKMKG